MKKIIALIITACLIGVGVFAVSTCEKEAEVDLSAKIHQKIVAYRTDLKDSASTLTTTDAMKRYLSNWAETKGIDYTVDTSDNVIFQIPSSPAYQNTPPTVLLCGYDPKHLSQCIDPISVALYVAKNNENTGALNVIFTENKNHKFRGIQKLDKSYFPDDANVFALTGGAKNMWSTATAGSASYTFSSNVTRTEPKGTTAYRISIEGLQGGIPDEKIAAYPNPIKELGDLLAYFKTNSLIFELASMNGGTSGNLYPDSASCTIVIDANDREKFQKRIDTAIENFYDSHEGLRVKYTYSETRLPDTVLNAEDMNKLISVLYTLVDGVYERNENDEILSITNIGAIKCRKDNCVVYASGNSLTEIGQNQIDLSYTTICGLSDIQYKRTASQDCWSIQNPDEDLFVQEVSTAFKEYSDDTMKYRDNITSVSTSFIKEKNPDCNLMSIAVNWKRIEKYAGTLITFMMNQNKTK